MTGIQLIVGLGNPGKQYCQTRHNAGSTFVDTVTQKAGVAWTLDSSRYGLRARLQLADHALWIFKPSSYMNLSGKPVATILSYLKIPPEQMLVVHDDLDLSPGTARLKYDGGHGGQNGLRDIIQSLGHGAFYRLRIGIGHPGHKGRVNDWVLSQPEKQDALAISVAMQQAFDILPQLAAGHVQAAMQTLHTHMR